MKKEIKLIKIYYWNNGEDTVAQFVYDNGNAVVKKTTIKEINKIAKENGIKAEKE